MMKSENNIPVLNRGYPVKVFILLKSLFLSGINNNKITPYEKKWWHFIYKIPRRY